jgi:Protein of unknown function (DUF1552)
MMIFKKSIPRRTFIRTAGATLALPFLDAMVPALAARSQTASRPPLRLGVVYVPNGMIMHAWTPLAEGTAYEATPILQPLQPFRNKFLVLSGLAANAARALDGEGSGDHARASAAFMSGVHPRKTEGSDLRAGISFDQLAARELGRHTQLASLEVALDANEIVGTCDVGYSCAYSNTLSWRSTTAPVPMENKPRAVFERLFGDSESTDPEERSSRMRKDRSILDFVIEDAARLASGLGPGDRAKLDEYLDSIRDVERRIQVAESQSQQELPKLDRPGGIPPTFTDHCKLMMDLQVLAYQCDLTRITAFMMGREQNTRVYTELGFSDAYHPLSHHQNDSAKIAKVTQIDILHAKMLAYYLDRLQSTSDGDGSLLDHVMIVYGSAMSDGNLHIHNDLPVLLIGGGSGKVQTGRHVRYPVDTPVTNLFIALLEKLDVHVEELGDSTGRLEV